MNIFLILIICIIIVSYLLDIIVSLLNINALQTELPKEFCEDFDKDEYAKSQEYTKDTTKLSIIENSFTTFSTLLFIILGGFNFIDIWVRSFGFAEIPTGLLFIGALLLLSFLIQFPFSIYSTFVIEERFGFNRTTVLTYIGDLIKTLFLAVILGGPLLAGVLWFFINTGEYSWIYCWAGVVLFTFIIQFLAPVVIMPMFNKFMPLEAGPLSENIQQYAQKENFQIKGIFTMDGSKRSSKLNAFFTGFGKFRKIVFYDTLLEKLDDSEIIAVLAHEMGHFKLHHIPQMMLASILQSGIMFYLLSLFLLNEHLSAAFKMEYVSTYSSLIFFGFLYSPISLFVSIFFNYFSRKNEYAADHYAISSTNNKESLVTGLKKLSKANLSNLTPHPIHVFMHYSHPPILERVRKISNSAA